MSDVVTARAAWNPMLDERKLQNDSYQVRDDMWETFRERHPHICTNSIPNIFKLLAA